MKKNLFIIFFLSAIAASAQLTLSEKSALAQNNLFQSRVQQALYSKANFWRTQTNPTNLRAQKNIAFAAIFLVGSFSYDHPAVVRTWLANYNGTAILDSNNQPTDNQLLDTAALDVVYDLLAGVKAGDQNLPIQ